MIYLFSLLHKYDRSAPSGARLTFACSNFCANLIILRARRMVFLWLDPNLQGVLPFEILWICECISMNPPQIFR